ncbi:hypothetical protein ZIOFF_005992 [Zingiber officinale]|uniref:ABC transporter domain-containing protein n=1 Tax=Zingiber officinale TaxID=94328 RepID=A0A8J5LS11_ZINOF|nr:hypothetical protein ZIOFF_005992 [Zingiber officinale]
MITQMKVSINRIQDFLKEEEQTQFWPSNNTEASSHVTLEIKPDEYNWEANSNSNSNSKKPTLKIDKRIQAMRGEKVAVCGSVGSGKSSFLYSIIGEIPRVTGGRITVFGTRAYVPQSAWIQYSTVQANVLFRKEMDRRWYQQVLESCALNMDIRLSKLRPTVTPPSWEKGVLT